MRNQLSTEQNQALARKLVYELVQSVGEPNTYLLIEEYADEAAMASHSESKHLKRLGNILGSMVAGPPQIKKYNLTSTEML